MEKLENSFILGVGESSVKVVELVGIKVMREDLESRESFKTFDKIAHHLMENQKAGGYGSFCIWKVADETSDEWLTNTYISLEEWGHLFKLDLVDVSGIGKDTNGYLIYSNESDAIQDAIEKTNEIFARKRKMIETQRRLNIKTLNDRLRLLKEESGEVVPIKENPTCEVVPIKIYGSFTFGVDFIYFPVINMEHSHAFDQYVIPCEENNEIVGVRVRKGIPKIVFQKFYDHFDGASKEVLRDEYSSFVVSDKSPKETIEHMKKERMEWEEALEEFAKLHILDFDWYHKIGEWECETSPIGLCYYNKMEDKALDHCLCCGQPHERN